jgi:hypothetical protein
LDKKRGETMRLQAGDYLGGLGGLLIGLVASALAMLLFERWWYAFAIFCGALLALLIVLVIVIFVVARHGDEYFVNEYHRRFWRK